MKREQLEQLAEPEVERVARAIAQRVFYAFDCQTFDRAGDWDRQAESDKETLRLIARDAIASLRSKDPTP